MANKKYRYKTLKLKYPVLEGCTHAYVSSDYGLRDLKKLDDDWHEGMDLTGPNSTITYICAAESGKIVYTKTEKEAGSCGNCVEILHGNGLRTRYLHLANKKFRNGTSPFPDGVKPGAYVRKGQRIGYMGNTGHSTGAHLHFDIRPKEGLTSREDPYPYLFDFESSGKIIPPLTDGNVVGTQITYQYTDTSVSGDSTKFWPGDTVFVAVGAPIYTQPVGDEMGAPITCITTVPGILTKVDAVNFGYPCPYRVIYNTAGDHGFTYGHCVFSPKAIPTELKQDADNDVVDLIYRNHTINHLRIINIDDIDKINKDTIQQYDTEPHLRTTDTYKIGDSITLSKDCALKLDDSGYEFCGYIGIKSGEDLNSAVETIIKLDTPYTFIQDDKNIIINYYYIPKTYSLIYDANGGTGGSENAPNYTYSQNLLYMSKYQLKTDKELNFTKDYHTFTGWSEYPQGPVDNDNWGISYATADPRDWSRKTDITLYAQYKKRNLSEFQIIVDESTLPDYYHKIDVTEPTLCLTEYSYRYTNSYNNYKEDITAITQNVDITDNINTYDFNSSTLDNESYRKYTIIRETIDGKDRNYFPYLQSIKNPFIQYNSDNNQSRTASYVALKGCFPTFERPVSKPLYYNPAYLTNDACTYCIERTDDYLLIKTLTGDFETKIARDSFKDHTVPYQLLAVGIGAGGQGACLQLGNHGNTYGYGGSSGAAAAVLINLFDAKAYITVGTTFTNQNNSQGIGINDGEDGTDTILEVKSNKNPEEYYSKILLQGGDGGKLHQVPQPAKAVYESTCVKPLLIPLTTQNGCSGYDYKNGENCPEFIATIVNQDLSSQIAAQPRVGNTGFYFTQTEKEGGICKELFDSASNLKYYVGGGGASIFGDGGDAMSCAEALSKEYQISYGAGGSCTYATADDSIIAGGRGGNGIVYLYY